MKLDGAKIPVTGASSGIGAELLMAVGKTMRDAATRAMKIEETAKLHLYCKQFGAELAVIPPQWVERLASVASFL